MHYLSSHKFIWKLNENQLYQYYRPTAVIIGIFNTYRHHADLGDSSAVHLRAYMYIYFNSCLHVRVLIWPFYSVRHSAFI